jgi:DNA polymerase III delta prime subunit
MLSEGDIKKIINYIQTISVNKDITINMFHEIFNVPPIKLLEQMLVDTQRKETQHKALEKVTFLLNQGYNYGDILEMLSKILAYSECIPEGARMLYLEELAKYYCEMTLYTNSVHLYALFSKFCKIR